MLRVIHSNYSDNKVLNASGIDLHFSRMVGAIDIASEYPWLYVYDGGKIPTREEILDCKERCNFQGVLIVFDKVNWEEISDEEFEKWIDDEWDAWRVRCEYMAARQAYLKAVENNPNTPKEITFSLD